jgi:hypothetical protein
LADDEEYDDWRLEHAGRHGKGAWELDDEEIEEMERQSARRPPPTQATADAGHALGELKTALEEMRNRARRRAD